MRLYSASLSGLSVLIPFVGAAVVTIPVVVVAGFQFGLSPEFAYVVGAYLIIQILDGNVLVPLIFSEVVDLHPVAIVVAVPGFWRIVGCLGSLLRNSLSDPCTGCIDFVAARK